MSAGAPVPAAAAARGCASVLPHADAHTPYGMTEVLPVTDISLSEPRGGRARATGSASGARCRASSVAVSPLAADGVVRGRPGHRRAGRDRRDLRAGRPRQGPLRPALGHRARELARPPAGTAPATSGTSTTTGRLWVEGRLVHVVTHRRRAGHPGRGRAAGRGPRRRAPRPRSSGSGRPAPSRSWSSSSRPATRRRGPTAPLGRRWPAPASPPPSVPPPGCRWPRCWSPTALPVDIRHASKIDRARVARWADRVLAGGRVGRP